MIAVKCLRRDSTAKSFHFKPSAITESPTSNITAQLAAGGPLKPALNVSGKNGFERFASNLLCS
jgi:hypothetical protein